MSNIVKLRTTSRLPEASLDDLRDRPGNTWLALSVPIQPDSNQYNSQKISLSKFAQSVKDQVKDGILQDVGGADLNYLTAVAHGLMDGVNEEFTKYNGTHEFTSALIVPTIDEISDPEYSKCAANIETVQKITNSKNSLQISKNASFYTERFNVENQQVEIITGNLMEAPSTEETPHNSFIFRIQGTHSNVWIATADGMFTCYGWVDLRDEPTVDNSKYWIALEGNFGDDDESGANWRILNLQPVVPNVFCSYVSFMFPVCKNMHLRLTSGFNVGTNSDQYSSVQGSLTNHVPNAFVGGVYNRTLAVDDGSSLSSRETSDIYINSLTSKFGGTGGEKTEWTLEATRTDNTLFSTSVTRDMFVAWLSAAVRDAVLAYLPESIVTHIDSSNIKIVSDATKQSPYLSIYNELSLATRNVNYYETQQETTSGEYVLGTNCGGSVEPVPAISDRELSGDLIAPEEEEGPIPPAPQKMYNIALSCNPPEGGNADGGGKHPADSEITITATPNEGYEFVSWSEDGQEDVTTPDYTIAVSADRSLTANFEEVIAGLSGLFLAVPVNVCSCDNTLNGTLVRNGSITYIMDGEVADINRIGELWCVNENPNLFVTPIGNYSSLVSMEYVINSNWDNLTAFNDIRKKCIGRLSVLNPGGIPQNDQGVATASTNGLVDFGHEIGFDPYPGSPSQSYPYDIEILVRFYSNNPDVSYIDANLEATWETDNSSGIIVVDKTNQIQPVIISVPACSKFRLKVFISDLPTGETEQVVYSYSIINNEYTWTETCETNVQNAISTLKSGIIATNNSLPQKTFKYFSTPKNEDERNYSKLIEDISKEIEV